jgi:lipid kinase YegS
MEREKLPRRLAAIAKCRAFLARELAASCKVGEFRNRSAVSMKTKTGRKRVRLILNGKVAGNDTLRAAVARQRATGHRIEVRVTWENGDARRFVPEAGDVDLLIAAGGDGTLNEVVHGLMDLPEAARPILGIVPLGTANDFATGCGIPRDPAKALALCMRGDAVPIDVGKADDYWFINAASSGFGAEIPATTSPELKRLLGPAAYTVMGAILAINLHHYQGRLTLPDREITGSGLVAIVGNGRQTGGGIQVAPRASIDDGLLDVLVVRQISPTALLAAARELQRLPPDGEYISYWQTPWLEVHPEEAIPVTLDGEPLRFSRVRYEAVPRAIQLIVPPNCPELSARLVTV